MSRLEQLKRCSSRADFAKLLGYKLKGLSYILFKINDQAKYKQFTIPKKYGGERIIKAPCDELKGLQRKLSDLLYDCQIEIYNTLKNDRGYTKPISYGARKKYSIKNNAEQHRKKNFVFNVDLEDFFSSINFGRVRGFFIENTHFSLHKDVATVIAQIACHDNELPQGSPCSPIISDFIANILDMRIIRLSKKHKFVYSRYMDDLTFSAKFEKSLESIAKKEANGKYSVGDELEKRIKKAGFEVNNRKTRMQYHRSRQVATGLVVNKKVNVTKEYYLYARAMCYRLLTTGSFYIAPTLKKWNQENEALLGKGKLPGTIEQLDGILSHISFIRKNDGNNKQDKNNNKAKPKGFNKVYRNFLFYKYFVSREHPVIVCEGKTDIIHLKCAIKCLPKILSREVNFFNRSESGRGNKVMDISTGADGFQKLIGFYNQNNKKNFEYKNPVIFVLDNDTKGKGIWESIKNKKGSEINNPAHHSHNVYVVKLPSDGAVIESYYDCKTKKKFGLDKGSKTDFAKKIRRHQDGIDFDKFKEILQAIDGAITHFDSQN